MRTLGRDTGTRCVRTCQLPVQSLDGERFGRVLPLDLCRLDPRREAEINGKLLGRTGRKPACPVSRATINSHRRPMGQVASTGARDNSSSQCRNIHTSSDALLGQANAAVHDLYLAVALQFKSY